MGSDIRISLGPFSRPGARLARYRLRSVAASGRRSLGIHVNPRMSSLRTGLTVGLLAVASLAAGIAAAGDRPPAPDYQALPRLSLPPLRALPANGLAKTPPMGWNSWNRFNTTIDEATVRQIADAMVSSGMREAGYRYIIIDDGWQGHRDAQGVLQPNSKFPDMKALAAYLHARGLKLGIYSSPGPRSCAGFEGSYGHERIDARTWASWGVDYLKYDWCSARHVWPRTKMRAVYQRMGAALQATGRPIVFSLCEYGWDRVERWGALVGGNLWRTTGDIQDAWPSMMENVLLQEPFASRAGPGHWNDPDMLEIGNGGMTPAEYRTHFSLWAIVAAPLIAGNDLRHMSAATRAILLNREVIAVDQDRLGRQGRLLSSQRGIDVWLRPLAGGAYALAIVNRGSAAVEFRPDLPGLGLRGRFRGRDLWRHAALGVLSPHYSAHVTPHGVVMLRLTPVASGAHHEPRA